MNIWINWGFLRHCAPRKFYFPVRKIIFPCKTFSHCGKETCPVLFQEKNRDIRCLCKQSRHRKKSFGVISPVSFCFPSLKCHSIYYSTNHLMWRIGKGRHNFLSALRFFSSSQPQIFFSVHKIHGTFTCRVPRK